MIAVNCLSHQPVIVQVFASFQFFSLVALGPDYSMFSILEEADSNKIGINKFFYTVNGNIKGLFELQNTVEPLDSFIQTADDVCVSGSLQELIADVYLTAYFACGKSYKFLFIFCPLFI